MRGIKEATTKFKQLICINSYFVCRSVSSKTKIKVFFFTKYFSNFLPLKFFSYGVFMKVSKEKKCTWLKTIQFMCFVLLPTFIILIYSYFIARMNRKRTRITRRRKKISHVKRSPTKWNNLKIYLNDKLTSEQ